MMWRLLSLLLLLPVLPLPVGSACAQGSLHPQTFRGELPRPPPRPYGFRTPAPHADPSRGLGAPTYRTLCVRLCDGYYFPVSHAVSGGDLARDAQRCTARCGSEARLFYHPNPGGDVATMTDLAGFGYTVLPNAFRYRRALVEGCVCTPQADAGMAEHRDGPAAHEAAHARAAVGADRSFDQAAPLAVDRPLPVSRYHLPQR